MSQNAAKSWHTVKAGQGLDDVVIEKSYATNLEGGREGKGVSKEKGGRKKERRREGQKKGGRGEKEGQEGGRKPHDLRNQRCLFPKKVLTSP